MKKKQKTNFIQYGQDELKTNETKIKNLLNNFNNSVLPKYENNLKIRNI